MLEWHFTHFLVCQKGGSVKSASNVLEASETGFTHRKLTTETILYINRTNLDHRWECNGTIWWCCGIKKAYANLILVVGTGALKNPDNPILPSKSFKTRSLYITVILVLCQLVQNQKGTHLFTFRTYFCFPEGGENSLTYPLFGMYNTMILQCTAERARDLGTLQEKNIQSSLKVYFGHYFILISICCIGSVCGQSFWNSWEKNNSFIIEV